MDQGWVALLQTRLKDQEYVYQVVNASVSGETTAGGLARLPRALMLHQPQIFILELGGNDAGIVLPGTHITPLLEKLFWGCFINAGQTCAALKRLYVHESQYDEVVQKFSDYVSKIPVGNGLDPKNLIGPVSN